MLRAPLRWVYRKLGPRYPRVITFLQFQLSHLVVAAGVGLLWFYVKLSTGEFLRILVVSQALVLIENALGFAVIYKLIRPADPWLRANRTPETAVVAWRALAGLPLDFFRKRNRWMAVFLNVVPISAYIVWELDYAVWPSLLVLCAGAAILMCWGMFLRFMALELSMRPVLEQISADLPPVMDVDKATLPLRWRLLVGLPVINVITGIVVVGLSSHHEGLRSLGVAVVVALAVASTIALELSVMLTRTIIEPLDDLREGTQRVAAGDYSVRVPVLGTDEAGQLAGAFNHMVSGLEERERLREAFGAFVDPVLADRVAVEGFELEGEEVEVSILFLDIRDFTAFAERSSAREVVHELTKLFELVVPIIVKHGGHANKFIGDGLMAVFGAPDRLPDHADRAVAAALEVARTVREVYGDRLRIGIGINSGPVIAGTIGGGGRVEFTVIGDAVNTAARVESVTRETGDDVLITEATRCLLTRDFGGFEERPTVALKGKTEQVRLYAPVAATEQGAADVEGAVRQA